MGNYNNGGNFRNNYGGNYSQRGKNYGSGNNYGNNYGGNNGGGGNRPRKKRSGCKSGETKGKKWIRAWNYSRDRGLITVLIAGYHGTKTVVNSHGEEGTLLMASCFFHRTGQTQTWPCILKHNTGKVVIDQLGMVANPKAPNGGYFGTFSKN